MLKRLFLLALMLTLVTVLQIGCGDDDDNGVTPTPVTPPRLIVHDFSSLPIGAPLTSDLWDSIDAEEIAVGTNIDYISNPAVTTGLNAEMKALIAGDTMLYIYVSWNDATKDDRFGELRSRYINNKIQWEYPSDTTPSFGKNEDRFYIIFDQGGTNGADCASFCHASANPSGKRFYGAAGDNADVWHWKAHRTGLAGFAEDMHITSTRVSPDPQDAANDSLYFYNYSTFFGYPLKMHPDGPDYTESGLIEGVYVPFDDQLIWVKGLPAESISVFIPGYYLNQVSGADGSRWDVKSYVAHDGLNWTVVFGRSLNSPDNADIDFVFSTPDSIQISIAIANNAGSKHFGVEPFYLVFE